VAGRKVTKNTTTISSHSTLSLVSINDDKNITISGVTNNDNTPKTFALGSPNSKISLKYSNE